MYMRRQVTAAVTSAVASTIGTGIGSLGGAVVTSAVGAVVPDSLRAVTRGLYTAGSEAVGAVTRAVTGLGGSNLGTSSGSSSTSAGDLEAGLIGNQPGPPRRTARFDTGGPDYTASQYSTQYGRYIASSRGPLGQNQPSGARTWGGR